MRNQLAAQSDADFQKARSYLNDKHVGDAIDVYKSLCNRGDYRCIEGLYCLRMTRLDWSNYLDPIIEKFDETHRPIEITLAMYPSGFSFEGLISVMEAQFGSSRSCWKVLDAMRTADWSHPCNVFEELVKVAGKSGNHSKRKTLLGQIGDKIGLDENAICFFMHEHQNIS